MSNKILTRLPAAVGFDPSGFESSRTTGIQCSPPITGLDMNPESITERSQPEMHQLGCPTRQGSGNNDRPTMWLIEHRAPSCPNERQSICPTTRLNLHLAWSSNVPSVILRMIYYSVEVHRLRVYLHGKCNDVDRNAVLIKEIFVDWSDYPRSGPESRDLAHRRMENPMNDSIEYVSVGILLSLLEQVGQDMLNFPFYLQVELGGALLALEYLLPSVGLDGLPEQIVVHPT